MEIKHLETRANRGLDIGLDNYSLRALVGYIKDLESKVEKVGEGKEVENAMNVLKSAMQDTELGSYAHSWHCNIAMMCSDAVHASGAVDDGLISSSGAHTIGNDAASRFMKLCFGIETTNENTTKVIYATPKCDTCIPYEPKGVCAPMQTIGSCTVCGR